MRLNVRKLFWLGALVVFSCQNNVESPVDEMSSAVELNLQNLSYNDVVSVLNGGTEIHNLKLTDGDIVKTVPLLKKMERVEIGGSDENNAVFYSGADEDSISIVLENSYASIKFRNKGEELGYVATTHQEDLERSIEKYNELIPQTRGANTMLTRATGSNSMKLNISAMSRTLLSEDQPAPCKTLEAEQTEEMDNPTQTRGYYNYTRWPRGNQLTIHLIADYGNYPLEWEVTWQVWDVFTSLHDIRPDLDIKVWISGTNYHCSHRNNSDLTLNSFINYCRSSSFPLNETAGHDIVFLVGWGQYGNAAGVSYTDTYKLSRYNNSWAYGVCATSVLYAKVLAHEVGHILGAHHVAATPWWQFWWNDDVMAPWCGKLAPYHWDSSNRNAIWNNLH